MESREIWDVDEDSNAAADFFLSRSVAAAAGAPKCKCICHNAFDEMPPHPLGMCPCQTKEET